MFDRKLKKDISDLKKDIIGPKSMGYTVKEPAYYSTLGKLNTLEKRIDRTVRIMKMLLNKLGYEVKHIEESDTLVKVKRKK